MLRYCNIHEDFEPRLFIACKRLQEDVPHVQDRRTPEIALLHHITVKHVTRLIYSLAVSVDRFLCPSIKIGTRMR
jgi:hypothetical protein